MRIGPELRTLMLWQPAGTNRRDLLRRLIALPTVICLAVVAEDDRVRAGKHRRKRKKRSKGKKGTGGGHAPDAEEQAFLGLINGYRSQSGVGQLALQGQLGVAATKHSQAMANQNSMYHSSNLATFLMQFGYRGATFGENIAAGYGTAQQVFTAWRNSPTHNQNMLNGAFTEIGVARAYNPAASYGWFWTTEFGSR
jgi:uncharacterized protein YkwD